MGIEIGRKFIAIEGLQKAVAQFVDLLLVRVGILIGG